MRPDNPPALIADMPELSPEVLTNLYGTPRRRGRPRLPRAKRVVKLAVGTRLRPPTYARLMAHLALTGERPAAFLRRAILQLLDSPSTADHA